MPSRGSTSTTELGNRLFGSLRIGVPGRLLFCFATLMLRRMCLVLLLFALCYYYHAIRQFRVPEKIPEIPEPRKGSYCTASNAMNANERDRKP